MSRWDTARDMRRNGFLELADAILREIADEQDYLDQWDQSEQERKAGHKTTPDALYIDGEHDPSMQLRRWEQGI